jgi:uroporphyrinogen decarboxylase
MGSDEGTLSLDPKQQSSDEVLPLPNALRDSIFLKACRKEKTERTPIWLMRQAGRFMPEYREIRERMSFLDLCKNSDLAAEVTVMAVEMLKVDAAIIFADILLPLEPMGVGLEYAKGDGPVIHRPVRAAQDVNNLQGVNAKVDLAYVMRSVKLARAGLPENIPLIGFAGAPFTLASYLIEGGSSRHFMHTKQFMYAQPQAWQKLMEFISDVTAQYLNAQIEAGVQTVQLFDSWVGCLGPDDYRKFVLPYSQRTINGITPGTPTVHFGTGNPTLLPLMSEAGGDVIGVDWRIELDKAWSQVPDKAVQGNLDPIALMADPDYMKDRAHEILRKAQGRPGHIFNLGHGILPQISVDSVKRLVEVVHDWQN